MKQFVEDIISYISSNLANDTDIAKTVKVGKAFKQGDTVEPPQISVQALDDSDALIYNTFDGELVSYVPIQITAYTAQMKIAGTTKSAQDSALIFADKIKAMFDLITTTQWNPNIVRMRRLGGIPAMPVETGATTYMSPVRFDFYVANPYINLNN